MSSSSNPAPFCSQCGAKTTMALARGDQALRPICDSCGHVHYAAPQLLVLVAVFLGERMLMIRRGNEPYVGKMAVPGGYVESFESVEAAAVRELQEEVGIGLSTQQLIPFGTLSVPQINQVHIVFITQLESEPPLHPTPPEVLEAGWYTREEVKDDELWTPALEFDIDLIFERGGSQRFDYYQRTEDWMRVISEGSSIKPVWKKSAP